MDRFNHLEIISDADIPSTKLLGRGIRKVVFLCGEIKDLISESDRHLAYLDNPDDPDLSDELEGLGDDELEITKRRYVVLLFVSFLPADDYR